MLVLGEILHRAVPTRIEDSIEIFLPDALKVGGLAELSFRSRVVLESVGQLGLKLGSLLLGSSGGRPPFGDASVISAPASLKTK